MRYAPVALSLIAIAAVIGACSAATQGGASRDCVLAAADSVLLEAGPVYRDCAVDRAARVLSRPLGSMSAFRPPPNSCMTAEVQFVVGPDGYPEPGTGRVVRSNNSAFGEAVLASTPNWRYEPAHLDGRPVRQIVRERQRVAVMVTATSGGQSRSSSRASLPPECR